MNKLEEKIVAYCKKFIEYQGERLPKLDSDYYANVSIVVNANEDQIGLLNPCLFWNAKEKAFTKISYRLPKNELNIKGLIRPLGLDVEEYNTKEISLIKQP